MRIRSLLSASAAAAIVAAAPVTPASADAGGTLVGGNPIKVATHSASRTATVTVHLTCSQPSTGFSALHVNVGPLLNVDGGRSYTGAVFQCTGKPQKITVPVFQSPPDRANPGPPVLRVGHEYTATVTLRTFPTLGSRDELLTTTTFEPRQVKVKSLSDADWPQPLRSLRGTMGPAHERRDTLRGVADNQPVGSAGEHCVCSVPARFGWEWR